MNNRTRERLAVEFEVERTIEREYGYQEKLLLFRGNNTRYKAIIKNGELIAIVGRSYKLVPNEEVERIVSSIAKRKNFDLISLKSKWRLYILMIKNGSGVLVSNSVDGTIALRADAIVYSRGSCSILVGEIVKNLYRRHTKNLSLNDLEMIIDKIYQTSIRYKTWIESFFRIDIEKFLIPLQKMLKESFPKVYYTGVFSKYYYYGRMNLKELYEEISRRIWSRSTDIRTKILLFKKLNNMMVSIGVAKLL